jgi:hypothetical protein
MHFYNNLSSSLAFNLAYCIVPDMPVIMGTMIISLYYTITGINMMI